MLNFKKRSQILILSILIIICAINTNFFKSVYLIIQNLIVHIHVTTAMQTSPKEIDLSVLQQQQHQLQANAAQVVPQDTQQTPSPQQMVPTMNQNEMPSSTSVSQPFGNGGPSNYAYF